ncbi:DUF6056 family protein [Helicobacter sp.]|uniref:DUF6056 family protein n=1 Tax=Helicobacter sp. TaxID=218 RepID=UPI0019C7D77B|nr:DUF6056 family protein [Helicobacter sp.]MBD5165201.1 hypothetical protein [Helicobacter sp.]
MTLRNNCIIFALIYSILFSFNFAFPPQADDLSMYFTAKEGNFGATYFSWNARIGEILYTGYFAKFIESVIFDLLNALMGTIFILSSFVLYRGKLPNKKQDYYMLALLCALILLLCCFGSTFLWGAGSFNYLWGVGFIVLFLLPFRIFWENPQGVLKASYKLNPLIIGLLFGIFAVVAGMASEMNIALCIVLLLSLCFAFYQKIKLPFWYFFGCIGFWIGWLLLYLSPATKIRSAMKIEKDSMLSLSELLDLSFWDKLLTLDATFSNYITTPFRVFLIVFFFFYLFKTTKTLKIHHWIIGALLIIPYFVLLKHANVFLSLGTITIILVLSIKLAIQDKKYYWLALPFGIWCLIGTTLIQLTGSLPARARLLDTLILIIIILKMFDEFYCANPQRITKVIGILLIFGIAFVGFNSYQTAYKWNHLKQFIAQEKSLGKQEIIIAQKDKKQFFAPQKYFKDFGSPADDIEHWHNRAYTMYFDLKSFKIE